MSMFKLRFVDTFARDVYAVQLLDVIVRGENPSIYFWVFELRSGQWTGNLVWDVTEEDAETAEWFSAFAGRRVETPVPQMIPKLIGRVAWAEMVLGIRPYDYPSGENDPIAMPVVVKMHPLDWAFTRSPVSGESFADVFAD